MDFYVISSLENNELMLLGDRLFCLAHFFVQDPAYKKWFLDIKKKYPNMWITLDNSAAERALVTEDVLIQVVKELRPNEVIAPDVLFDKKATLANLESFKQRMASEGLQDVEIFGCPQGATKEDYIECYRVMLEDPQVKTIGMSKIAIPFALTGLLKDQAIAESRQQMTKELAEKGLLGKPLHYLGMGDPREYDFYTSMSEEDRQWIRSSDSCYTVLASTKGISFNEGNFERVETTEDFYHHKLSLEEIKMTLENVFFLKSSNRFSS